MTEGTPVELQANFTYALYEGIRQFEQSGICLLDLPVETNRSLSFYSDPRGDSDETVKVTWVGVDDDSLKMFYEFTIRDFINTDVIRLLDKDAIGGATGQLARRARMYGTALAQSIQERDGPVDQ